MQQQLIWSQCRCWHKALAWQLLSMIRKVGGVDQFLRDIFRYSEFIRSTQKYDLMQPWGGKTLSFSQNVLGKFPPYESIIRFQSSDMLCFHYFTIFCKSIGTSNACTNVKDWGFVFAELQLIRLDKFSLNKLNTLWKSVTQSLIYFPKAKVWIGNFIFYHYHCWSPSQVLRTLATLLPLCNVFCCYIFCSISSLHATR